MDDDYVALILHQMLIHVVYELEEQMERWRMMILPREVVDGAAEATRIVPLLTQIIHLIAFKVALIQKLFDV